LGAFSQPIGKRGLWQFLSQGLTSPPPCASKSWRSLQMCGSAAGRPAASARPEASWGINNRVGLGRQIEDCGPSRRVRRKYQAYRRMPVRKRLPSPNTTAKEFAVTREEKNPKRKKKKPAFAAPIRVPCPPHFHDMSGCEFIPSLLLGSRDGGSMSVR